MKAAIIGLLGLFMLWSVLFAAADAAAPADAVQAEQDLIELRDRLQRLERDLGQQADRRDHAQRDLRAAERAEATIRSRLKEIDAERTAARERSAVLQRRADDTRAELAVHVAGLERELRRAYIVGRDDWLRAVLSQRDPVRIGRQLVYSGYLARERSAVADAVRADLASLDATRAALDQEDRRLQDIASRERERLAELETTRKDRSAALVRINAAIKKGSRQAERLRAEAKTLQALVDELTRALAALPIGDADPFGTTRGRLDWPAAGRVARRFGQSKADGQMRWNGVLLAADPGVEVRAVHHGRVVYADWLQGMGMLVILEHGDGYLSLYGHNQDIVAETGEWVAAGDVIAHIGDSGGQTIPGLYFEIRKDGQPIDPAGWIQQ